MRSNLPDDLRASLDVPPDVRGELRARRRCALGSIAQRVHWLTTAGSTNDVAARLAELGADEGTTVVAEAQTAGRGRHGRAVVLAAWRGALRLGGPEAFDEHPLSSRENPAALLTLASGVAIAEGVRAATGLPAEIKWPNDVLIGRRKLAGILAEAAAQTGEAAVHRARLWREPAAGGVSGGAGVARHVDRGRDQSARRSRAHPCRDSRRVSGALRRPCALARFDAILSSWRRLAPSLPSAAASNGIRPAASSAGAPKASTIRGRCSSGSAIASNGSSPAKSGGSKRAWS